MISKTFDADFKDITSNFGNGLPTEGQLDGSAISQTKDSGYIVGTYVNPRHSSYGYTHIFKTDSQGEIEWKRELKYKSGSAKVVHFVEDIMQTSDGHFVAIGYTSGDSGNQIKGQGFMTKIDKDSPVSNLQINDIIVEAQKKKIKSIKDLEDIVNKALLMGDFLTHHILEGLHLHHKPPLGIY